MTARVRSVMAANEAASSARKAAGSKAQRVRRALARCVMCTSRDIADECRMTQRHARAWIYLLIRQGHVRKLAEVIRGNHRPLVLYELTERGRSLARRRHA